MTTEELQTILQNPKKLSLRDIKNIIWEIKHDCWNEVYNLQNELPPEISKEEKDGITSFKATLQNIGKEQFYMGEINALYICLDLLDKLEVK